MDRGRMSGSEARKDDMAFCDKLKYLNECVAQDSDAVSDSFDGHQGKPDLFRDHACGGSRTGMLSGLWRRLMRRCYVSAHAEGDEA